ncbi:MAG TPA: AgmX/PglI C-terminal domain-containing protein [Labilithrix sp.]|nr:AgmX/PglI C-terminal domain-containing protein [Labilithrix sp.]
MTKAKPLALLATTIALATASACGTPPAPTAPSPSDTASSTAEGASPPESSSPSAAPSPSEPSAVPPSESAASASSSEAHAPTSNDGVPVAESKDECTPVGVDFEKRARPKLKECYAAGKKKKPNLEGTVKIKVTVDMYGKIKSTKITEKTLPDPVAACMLKAIQSTPFPEVDKCWGATLLIPVTFPTPK